MAAASPTSTSSSGKHVTLADIGAELATMIVTKDDLQQVSTTLHATLKSEVAGLKADFADHEASLTWVEQRTEAVEQQARASDTAIQRQRQLEDLDNRDHRSNIRIHGVPEADGDGASIAEILTQLFQIILCDDAPDHFRFEWTHRAFRPWSAEGGPRDIICCLYSFPLKEQIMQKAHNLLSLELQGLELPTIAIQNQILHPVELRPLPQRPPCRRGRDPTGAGLPSWRPDLTQSEEYHPPYSIQTGPSTDVSTRWCLHCRNFDLHTRMGDYPHCADLQRLLLLQMKQTKLRYRGTLTDTVTMTPHRLL
ncbi:Hypothetical predicted protein [Pelobates cultripes]|uniref:Uncharacterized protein n=1 Tax=Pelobates cultripes TaxID=61616 RepID=A0AAD1RCP0_PELCU|nr:Hypothetical predicted protein [Pelobates cultripes]